MLTQLAFFDQRYMVFGLISVIAAYSVRLTACIGFDIVRHLILQN
jgi:hypothetical protein